ncbi:hypothetical protein LTR37_018078 [Vermiconidia calcicola]|uniref:Uncharacterized protein n=1 Tax=Vermiconidia calcicola TaxID=1690605 RepID=A0ACC3MI42_9PEZI|nr:hypothetical protein LTR37_018078 [Vermiconidia calcicola]
MRASEALICLKFLAIVYAASDAPRPRGVGPEFAKHYKDAKTFACISNPSIKLPFARVNDDYCDCPDGSDEPGTSACAHLSSYSPQTPGAANATQALPGFYCKNKGHVPSYVPFTNVNDGVCDYESCCDGSEEWDGVGGVKCEDRCKEIGKEWRKQDEVRQRSQTNAAKKRKELVAEAAKIKIGIQDRLQSLTTEIEGSELKVKQLETELADVERREKGKIVKPAGGKGGKMGVLIGLARDRTEDLREHLVRVRDERDSSRSRLQEVESILSTFKEEYNPNFNDEGVKRAVRAWEDYAARDKGPEPKAALDRDLEELTKTDKENGLDWDEYEAEEETDTDVLYAFENYLPSSLRGWLDQKLRDLRLMLVEGGILAASTDSSTESKHVTEARKRLKTAEKDLDGHRKDLKKHNEDLNDDFGPDDVFRALKGTCVSTDSGEYTYELCFLERTTQKPKKGGGHTNMGNFVRMERMTVDEDLPPNGKGLGSGERIVMKHENGQHCWNGPNRQTTVILGCAEENEIWKIMEEEKCIYRMEVGSPAVCEGANGGGGKGAGVKDEL